MISMQIILVVGCVVTLVHGYNEVCYGDLGCFTDGPPFGGTKIRMKGYLPDEPSKVLEFFFFILIYSFNNY